MFVDFVNVMGSKDLPSSTVLRALPHHQNYADDAQVSHHKNNQRQLTRQYKPAPLIE